ncbi:bactofilin family protein [Xylophilus sp. ASV27]|uniref:bactofilin family protein n=1 Tax=Xylophilus sp. ASV27 TaxID=2795129 RepID=UPI0018EE1CFE|nr:polymer-forming cytoskeletal protein [Xylophilus sp. ASV27]
MALQSPFFGKREAEPLSPRTSPPAGSSSMALPSSSGAAPSTLAGAPASEARASAGSGAPGAATSAAAAEAKESASKLTVGPNIKLKGVEITDCDTLVVEGIVEATMDSRVIRIAEQGAFKGSAEIDIAEIHGAFDGSLTVRDKLVIYSTGRVTGTVRYGKLVVEEGGQLSGEIGFGFNGGGKPVVPPPA